ncbi:MAG: hypothetical protein PHS70_11765, partial [Acidithiobacillus sp.]|nr:hypothetical protein [Acidithiobacillus sp.]
VPKQEETGMANLYNLHRISALRFLSTTVTAITIAMIPNMASACACGCGVFNLGLPGLPSTFYKTRISLQYDYMNQNETQHGSSVVSGSLSPDKQIETNFFNLNIQHMFNHQWGIMAMIPYWNRHFVTDSNGTVGLSDASQGVSPQILTSNATVLSDIRIMGMYTGFSNDMSSGITFGLKLPTGPTNAGNYYQGIPIMDRDTQPGTGTNDLLLGGYKMGNESDWGWFAQILWRHALDSYQGYRPGDSVNLAVGAHYDGIEASTHLTPTLQLNYQWRGHDQGGGDAAYGNMNSGYSNLYITPGVQVNLSSKWLLNTSVYLPIYRYANGYQQVAHFMVNAGVTYQF